MTHAERIMEYTVRVGERGVWHGKLPSCPRRGDVLDIIPGDGKPVTVKVVEIVWWIADSPTLRHIVLECERLTSRPNKPSPRARTKKAP